MFQGMERDFCLLRANLFHENLVPHILRHCCISCLRFRYGRVVRNPWRRIFSFKIIMKACGFGQFEKMPRLGSGPAPSTKLCSTRSFLNAINQGNCKPNGEGSVSKTASKSVLMGHRLISGSVSFRLIITIIFGHTL